MPKDTSAPAGGTANASPDSAKDSGTSAFSNLPSRPKPVLGKRKRCKVVKKSLPATLPACTRDNIQANSVPDWCKKKFETDATAEAQCSVFVAADTTSKAYDAWYNTLQRNYDKQKKANVGEHVPVKYKTINTLEHGSKLIEGDEVVLDRHTGLAAYALVKSAQQEPGVKASEKQKEKYNAYNAITFEGGGTAMEFSWHPGSGDTRSDCKCTQWHSSRTCSQHNTRTNMTLRRFDVWSCALARENSFPKPHF